MPNDHTAGRALRAVVPALLAATLLACTGRDGSEGDTTAVLGDSAGNAATAAAGGSVAATDTAAGAVATANRPAPRDSNQAFLRMMSDHHEGLIVMSDSARPRLQGTAQTDAQRIREKQDQEQERMLAMLSQQYSDSIMPQVLPSNRAMIDSVTGTAQGANTDATFYRQVIAHHREGMQHVEMHLQHLTGEVRQLAERMRTEQQREIRELERKAQGTQGGARSGG